MFGFAQGAFAEKLVADWTNLLPVPKGLSFEHASVVPLYVSRMGCGDTLIAPGRILLATRGWSVGAELKLVIGCWSMLARGESDWPRVRSQRLSGAK